MQPQEQYDEWVTRMERGECLIGRLVVRNAQGGDEVVSVKKSKVKKSNTRVIIPPGAETMRAYDGNIVCVRVLDEGHVDFGGFGSTEPTQRRGKRLPEAESRGRRGGKRRKREEEGGREGKGGRSRKKQEEAGRSRKREEEGERGRKRGGREETR